MSAAHPAAQGALVAGWYGKVPATGDFVVRRLPEGFREAWDRWLQQCLEGARERLGAGWQECYLSMPSWRFLLSGGMLTPDAWVGVMVPSVDAVGRQFPLTVACPLAPMALDLAASMEAAAGWFAAVEVILIGALAPKANLANIDAAIAARSFPADALRRRDVPLDATVPFRSARAQMRVAAPARLRALAAQLAEPCALWVSGDTETFDRCALLCESLPTAAQFCGMMDGRWRQHGWTDGAEAG